MIKSYSVFNFSSNEGNRQKNIQLSSNRLTWVDHARGIAILFVVYRHVIIGMRRSGLYVSDFMYNIQEIVYNFRMPVFFVLSGIFVARSLKKKSINEVLRFRSANILYPYFIWGIITVVLQILFSSYANSQRVWTDIFKIILEPRSVDHLWYLLALFNVSLIYFVFKKINLSFVPHLLISIGLYFFSKTHYLEGNSLMSDAFYFYIYFHIGIIVSDMFLTDHFSKKLLRPINILFILPFFLAGQFFWFENKDQDLQYALLFLFINLLACYFIFLLSSNISSWKGTQWLAFLGSKSLYIYLLHVFISSLLRNILVFYFPNIDSWFFILLCFPLCLILPILIYEYLIKRGFFWLFTLNNPKKN